MTDKIIKLECNTDDCTGEILGYTLARLMSEGALEANCAPVFMKKNRPGWLLTVLCAPDMREKMEDIIFSETGTLGIRRQEMERTVLLREETRVSTSLGDVRIKVSQREARDGAGKTVTADVKPEYEDAAAIAREKNMPLREVLDILNKEIAAQELLS